MEFIKCCPKCESRKTGILSVTRKEMFIAQQTTNVVRVQRWKKVNGIVC